MGGIFIGGMKYVITEQQSNRIELKPDVVPFKKGMVINENMSRILTNKFKPIYSFIDTILLGILPPVGSRPSADIFIYVDRQLTYLEEISVMEDIVDSIDTYFNLRIEKIEFDSEDFMYTQGSYRGGPYRNKFTFRRNT